LNLAQVLDSQNSRIGLVLTRVPILDDGYFSTGRSFIHFNLEINSSGASPLSELWER